MSPEQEVQRAGEAVQILKSPLFVAAREHLVKQMAEARRAVPMTESLMHTRLILAEQLMGYFFDYFEQIAQTGRLAEMKLEEERQRRSLAERGIAMFKTLGRNY